MADKTRKLYWLLSRGLVSARDAVDGAVTVREASSRHSNVIVTVRGTPRLFVKAARADQPFSQKTLRHEAICYHLTQEPGLTVLSTVMPAYRAYDPDQNILALEMLPQARNLGELHRERGHFPDEIAVAIGQALATYHQTSVRDAILSHRAASAFTVELPWALILHKQTPLTVLNLSPANEALISILRNYPGYGKALDELASTWKPEALIHTDIKFENFVVFEGQTGQMLKLVDWELATFGDPHWDLGAVMQAYIVAAFSKTFITSGGLTNSASQELQKSLDEKRSPISHFWSSYLANRPNSEPSFERALTCCGARMLQTVFESMANSQVMLPHAPYLLQASLNILIDPKLSMQRLFGVKK